MHLPKVFVRNRCPLLVGLIVLMLLPFLIGADERPDRAALREKIESLPAARRKKLQENFDRYRNLSEEEQKRYRQFHADLETAPDSRRLQNVMRNYHEWLMQSISQFDLNDIRDETDPVERLELVKTLKQNQDTARSKLQIVERMERRQTQRFLLKAAGADLDGRTEKSLRFAPILSPVELQALIQAIEESLELNRQQRRQLDELTRPSRNVRVLRLALAEASAQPQDAQTLWPDKDLKSRMINAIPPGHLRDRLTSSKSGESRGRFRLMGSLVRGVMNEWQANSKQYQPRPEELSRYSKEIQKLLESDRSRHSRRIDLSPEEQQRVATLLHAFQQDSEFALEFSKLMQHLRQWYRTHNRHRDEHRRSRSRGGPRYRNEGERPRRPPQGRRGVFHPGRNFEDAG